MKRFLRNHTTGLFAVFALALLVFIAAYFAWGIGDIIFEVSKANNSQAVSPMLQEYNLKAAAALDYRGVLSPAATSVGQ